MNIITNIFESFYRYALRKEIVIKTILLIEMISIFIELTITVGKSYGLNLIKKEFSNFDFGENYSLYLLYISPYFLIKNIYECKRIETDNLCYFSNNFFLGVSIIVIILFLSIYIINYKKDIYYSRLSDIGFSYYVKKILYTLVDIFVFKIFSFSLFYLFINKIITSFMLYLNNDYSGITYIFLGLICIILFIISNYCYVKYFNLIIQIEESYHHDNMFSINYDFFLLALKIILCIENSIANFDKNNSLQLRMVNYLILLYSYLFILYIINCCFYGKIMFIINFSLNKFRIFLVLFMNLNITFYIILYSNDFSYEQGILTLLIFISIVLLSIVLTNKIMDINQSNIYFSDQLVLTVLHIINENYKYNFEIDMTNKKFNRKILDKKELINAKIIFESKIHNSFLNHKYKCNMKECLICNVKDLTFDNLVYTYEKQVESMVDDIRYKNRLSLYSYQCLELLKLLYIQNREKEKKVKLLYLTKHSMIANKKNYGLLNNIVVFFTYINKEIISTRKFVLLKNYYDTNHYFKEIIQHLEDIINCYVAENNKDLNKVTYDLNYLKEKIDDNISFFSKYKNIYVDEYNLTIIKFMYENLFNVKSSENLNMYNLDLMEDKLEHNFSTDRLMVLDFATETNILKILRSSQEFNEFNNGRFALMFPTELRKAAEEELVKKINNSDNLTFKFEYIANNYSYIRLFKLIKGYILPSIRENYLMITSEYDVEDHNIILLEAAVELDLNEENIGKFFISNFTCDLGEIFFLNPNWLKVIKSTRFLWRTQFEQFFNLDIQTTSSEIHVIFNYKNYINVYNNLVSVLKEFPDYSTNEIRSLYKENLAIISKYASEDKSIHFKLLKALEIKSGFKKYHAIKLIQDINSNIEEPVSLLFNKNLNESRQGTIITASSTKSLTSISNKKLTESNNLTLSRYTKCTLIFNICLIIYCLIYLIIGIDNNKRFDRLYETRIKFISVKNNIQHTYLSLFFSIYIMDENKKKTSHIHDNKKYGIDLHEYVNSEVTHKINFVTEVITQYESNVYSYKYNNRLKDLFEITSEYEYYAIIDDKVQIKKKEVNFLYILKQFANNCKVIDENKSGSLKMYLVNIENNEMKFPDYVDINKIPRYILTMYELILNYNKYLNLIAYVEKEIDQEHLENMQLLFMVNFNLTLVLILVHFILIFICYRIIVTIRTILTDNNKIINSIMHNDNIKFLKNKFINLKKLSELYAMNPVTILNNIRANANEYHQASKLEKSKENKSSNETQTKVTKNFQFKIDYEKIIKNFTNILIITFTLYFIYSVALYIIFYSTYLSIRDTTDYLFYYSKVVNSIYNNAVMLKTSMILNRTDIQIARNFNKNESINYGYIQENINSFFRLENDLKISRLSPAVKYHYQKAEKELMNCDSNYDLFNDELIRRSITNRPELLNGIKKVCKNIPIMRTDLDQLYNDIMYNYQKILIQYNSSKREYKNVKNIFKEDSNLENIFILLLFVFRPIEVYITLIVNRNTITEVNQNYLFFTFIYLSLNILVDVFLCVIVYLLILRKTAIINRYYNSLIGCLRT